MNEEIIDINKIRRYIKNQKILWTQHCLNRINQRNILIDDVKIAINNGRIIEYYYEDYPYASCLIIGRDRNNKFVHIVTGIGEDIIYMITAYYPDIDKWESNMRDRR